MNAPFLFPLNLTGVKSAFTGFFYGGFEVSDTTKLNEVSIDATPPSLKSLIELQIVLSGTSGAASTNNPPQPFFSVDKVISICWNRIGL